MEGVWPPCGGAGATLLAGDCCLWEDVAAVDEDELDCDVSIVVVVVTVVCEACLVESI